MQEDVEVSGGARTALGDAGGARGRANAAAGTVPGDAGIQDQRRRASIAFHEAEGHVAGAEADAAAAAEAERVRRAGVAGVVLGEADAAEGHRDAALAARTARNVLGARTARDRAIEARDRARAAAGTVPADMAEVNGPGGHRRRASLAVVDAEGHVAGAEADAAAAAAARDEAAGARLRLAGKKVLTEKVILGKVGRVRAAAAAAERDRAAAEVERARAADVAAAERDRAAAEVERARAADVAAADRKAAADAVLTAPGGRRTGPTRTTRTRGCAGGLCGGRGATAVDDRAFTPPAGAGAELPAAVPVPIPPRTGRPAQKKGWMGCLGGLCGGKSAIAVDESAFAPPPATAAGTGVSA